MSDHVFSLNGAERVSFKFSFGPTNLGVRNGELMPTMKFALRVHRRWEL